MIAAELARHEVGLVGHRPYPFDHDLIQRDPDGNPFVHHRSLSKWNLWGANRPVCDERFHKPCDDAIAELRHKWTGVVFHPPARTSASLADENRLVATRWFRYLTSVVPQRTLELLPGGQVGEGRAEYEQHWAVVETPQGNVLQFFSAVRLTVELQPCADGSWKGVSRSSPAFDARLVSRDDGLSWPHADEGRIARSAAIPVDSLLNASLPLGGFDAAIADELRSALSYLNRVFDDVPERIASCLEARPFEQVWRETLRSWADELSGLRNARLQATGDRAVHPIDINPTHYRRLS